MNRISNLLFAVMLGSLGLAFVVVSPAQHLEISKRVMTDAEFSHLKKFSGVYEKGKNYNVVIDGHGTGLIPPTEEQWQLLREQVFVVDKLEAAESLPASHDNSASKWFPPVGDQASENSCVAWATAYYVKTLQEAYEHDWDLTGCEWDGQAPSVDFQNRIFSPDFVYHHINGGTDRGSTYDYALLTLKNIGCSSWAKMPNDPYNSVSWPSENAWREAPLYRSLTGMTYMQVTSNETINNLKGWLANHNLAIISIDAGQYANLGGKDLWKVDTYLPGNLNHANTVVGYDDNFGPYTENGQPNTYGAFKVVNSWGTGFWEKVADGFYFISYECFKQAIGQAYVYENWIDYEPKMVAAFQIDHARSQDCEISVNVGDEGQSRTKPFCFAMENNYSRPFPSQKMVMDITDFMPFMAEYDGQFFLRLMDSRVSDIGTLNYFGIETYDDYASGNPTQIFVSPDPPLNTVAIGYIYAHVSVPGNTIGIGPPELVIDWPASSTLFRVFCASETMTWGAAVTSGADWMQIVSGASGIGDGSIEVHFDSNSGAVRTGKITVTSPQAVNSPLYITVIQNSPSQFRQVQVGEIVETGSSVSCAWGDYDGDSDLDLFVGNRNDENNFLYNHNPHFDTFDKIDVGPLVNHGGNSFGSSWADYDNDSDLDLFVANKGQNNFLYKNIGSGDFEKIIAGAIVNDGGNSLGCSWGDYDNDGFVDLIVANDGENNFLYHNNGGGFTKITSGPVVSDGGNSTSGTWADYDNDGDLDLFVTNYQQNNCLYRNDGGAFVKITIGAIVNDGGASFGSSWGDYDNDGDCDLFVTNDGENNFLYENNGDASFTKITTGAIVNDGGASFGSSWADTDNDGDLDLFVANKNQENFLYVNHGAGAFTRDLYDAATVTHGSLFGCAFADYNDDGYSDLFIANSAGNNLLFENIGYGRNWIKVRCVGVTSNRSAIGGKVQIKANIGGVAIWQVREISAQTGGGYGGQNSLTAEFGLGDAAQVDSLRIEWPSRAVQVLTNVSVNHGLTVVEQDIFTKITAGDLAMESGNGGSWGDYNNDGFVDLYVPRFGQNSLYKNNGDRTFTKITNGEIVNDGGLSRSASWGDYDNDGDLDLFVAKVGVNALYSNSGDGSFTKITEGEIVTNSRRSYGGSWGDYDNDSDLDMFVANWAASDDGASLMADADDVSELYANNGDGTFTKMEGTGIDTRGAETNSCSWADFDHDRNLDLVVNNYYENFLYTNRGDGTFSMAFLGDDSEGSSWADYDNDGDLDLFMTGSDNLLFTNNGDGTFISQNLNSTHFDYSYGSAWGDYDNDGDSDLFVTTEGDENLLFINNGNGTFTPNTASVITNDGGGQSASWADIDNDGDLDLFVAGTPNRLYINNTEGEHWIKIHCIGVASNRSAIGARVSVKAAINGRTYWQMQECSGLTGAGAQNSLDAEFGLGDATIIDSLKIEWPGGAVEVYRDLTVNQVLTVTENSGVVPVELTSFSGQAENGKVRLSWVTATETNNYGFEIERKIAGSEFSSIAFVEGAGSTAAPRAYSFVDESVQALQRYNYRLKQIDLDGSFAYSDVIEVEVSAPRNFSLSRNYPNPCNPSTTIEYTIAEKATVRLEIFNMLGQKVRTLVAEEKLPGFYKIQWDGLDDAGTGVPSGLYLYRMQAGSLVASHKMIILK
jgi:C1A family cysteine protease